MNTSDNKNWTQNEISLWKQKKVKLRSKYPFIPAREFEYTGDMEEAMLRMLCYKLRLTKENMIYLLSTL